jgi:hypothetical protein
LKFAIRFLEWNFAFIVTKKLSIAATKNTDFITLK